MCKRGDRGGGGGGAGHRLCCGGGVGGKGSLDADQGQEYQRDEEGPDGNFQCDACGKWVGGLLQHAFGEDIPWLVRPDSACWVCHRQYVLPSNAIQHFKESGHEGSFSGGRLGLWAEGIRKIIERGASRRGWKDWEETLVGRYETVVGGTWGLDRGFGMEGRVVWGFL